MSFIDSDESDFSNSEEDYEPSDEVESEPMSDEATESDIDEINIFPITVHRKKRVVRFVEYEYY